VFSPVDRDVLQVDVVRRGRVHEQETIALIDCVSIVQARKISPALHPALSVSAA